MFETAVIRAQNQAPERRAGLLTASVAAHTLAVGALIIAGIQSLTLPTHAPNQPAPFIPVIGPPIQSGVVHGSTTVTHPPTRQPAPRTATAPRDAAPQVIPDQTQVATSSSTSTGSDATAASGPERIGVPDGPDVGIPPTSNATSQSVVTAAEPRIYHVSEVNPPVVVTRVLPEFPRMAQMAHKSGWAIVECVIDSSGHIRDAHVTASSWDVFDKPALDAVQQWMFKPGSLNGQAVNTLFELRVTFTLH